MEFTQGITQFRHNLKRDVDDILYLARTANQIEGSEAKDLGETLTKFIKTMGEMDTEAVILEQTISALSEYLKDAEDIPTDANFTKNFEKIAKKHKKAVGDIDFFKDAYESIQENFEVGNADEMQVMQVQHSRKDPISKKDIVNPVIYKACGHVYDRESIYEFAGKKRSIKCAMQGCSTTITLSNLVDYPDFWQNIKQD